VFETVGFARSHWFPIGEESMHPNGVEAAAPKNEQLALLAVDKTARLTGSLLLVHSPGRSSL
jgi:hypothetical protein